MFLSPSLMQAAQDLHSALADMHGYGQLLGEIPWEHDSSYMVKLFDAEWAASEEGAVVKIKRDQASSKADCALKILKTF